MDRPLQIEFDEQGHPSTICSKTLKYCKDFMSLEIPPSYSNYPMYHRNDRLLTVRIIPIYNTVLVHHENIFQY